MSPPPADARFHVFRGLSHAEGVSVQKSLLAEMAANPGEPEHILFVEHVPVVTCGRSGDGGNLLVPPGELARRGVEFHMTNRGGDVTYHGPGQWTVYPVVRLDRLGRDLHAYLRLLEECVIAFLAPFGIEGTRRRGLTGVWAGREKVAAVGVAVSRWIAWHGFAVNIDPDLSAFTGLIVPCGIGRETGSVTSLSRLAGRRIGMDETLPALAGATAAVLAVRPLPEIAP